MQDQQDLVKRIKAAVEALQWSEDWLALDKELGEIDYLLYKLRSLVVSPPPQLDDILASIGDDL
jgi:hypothetical protein